MTIKIEAIGRTSTRKMEISTTDHPGVEDMYLLEGEETNDLLLHAANEFIVAPIAYIAKIINQKAASINTAHRFFLFLKYFATECKKLDISTPFLDDINNMDSPLNNWDFRREEKLVTTYVDNFHHAEFNSEAMRVLCLYGPMQDYLPSTDHNKMSMCNGLRTLHNDLKE